MTFEYRIFNKSEAETANLKNPGALKKNWLDVLNDLGADGWEVKIAVTNNSYLMMRRRSSPLRVKDEDGHDSTSAVF